MITFNDLRPTNFDIHKGLNDAYRRVMRSGRYIGGVEVEAFEVEFAAYVGAKHCIAVGSGFDALLIALKTIFFENRNDVRVGVPTNTCVPTWAAVYEAGARIVPLEPDPRTMNIKYHPAIEELHGVIPVHLYGSPIFADEIRRMKLNTWVIEDACQAHGSYSDGFHAGTLGDMGCFSFYPTKNLGCYGDGGAIVTDDPILADQARALRRYGKAGAINSCLDPLQAAFLRVRLKHLDRQNNIRRQLAALYCENLADCESVELPYVYSESVPNYHQFVIRAVDRDGLQLWLEQNNIQTMVHYRNLPFDVFDIDGYKYDIAKGLRSYVLSLPIANVTPNEVEYICKMIMDYYYG